MNDSPNILVHIGYVKTGSTFLQKRVFTPENGFQQLGTQIQLRDLLVKPYELHFSEEEFLQAVSTDLDNATKNNLVPVLTCERLSGNPFSGGHDQLNLFGRVQRLFPNARYLIVVRNQPGFLVSSYYQCVSEGYPSSIRSFLNPPDGAKVPTFQFDYLKFSRLIEHYANNAGRDQVLTLPYELLTSAPGSFFESIFTFAGLDPKAIETERRENKSRGAAWSVIKTWLNRFSRSQYHPNPFLNMSFLNKIFRRINISLFDKFLRNRSLRIVSQLIPEDVFEDNEATQSFCEFDLGELGYRFAKEQ